MPGILRFVNMLFLIFEKGDKQKAVPGILRFASISFLIFKKRMSKKTVPGILRFVNMLFLCEYFLSMNGGYRDIWGLYVCFL